RRPFRAPDPRLRPGPARQPARGRAGERHRTARRGLYVVFGAELRNSRGDQGCAGARRRSRRHVDRAGSHTRPPLRAPLRRRLCRHQLRRRPCGRRSEPRRDAGIRAPRRRPVQAPLARLHRRLRSKKPMILPQEIIRAKRDGRDLTGAEIGAFIAGLTSGAVTEGQAAAFAMAVFFNGMTLDERVALTRAMTLSGETLDWRAPDLPGPVLDKHSTGGVGDNVSLMLAPMLAA